MRGGPSTPLCRRDRARTASSRMPTSALAATTYAFRLTRTPNFQRPARSVYILYIHNASMAHVPEMVVGLQPDAAAGAPSRIRRDAAVTALTLYDHSNIFMYCSRYTLFTPRD